VNRRDEASFLQALLISIVVVVTLLYGAWCLVGIRTTGGGEMVSESINEGDELSDLGDKAMHDWHLFECTPAAPGDYGEEEVGLVGCPECLAKFEDLKQRRARAR